MPNKERSIAFVRAVQHALLMVYYSELADGITHEAVAERMGVPPEELARSVLKMEAHQADDITLMQLATFAYGCGCQVDVKLSPSK